MKQIQTPKWGKPGNIAMMVPGGLLLLMGIGAFVFDLGYISLEKTRLQVAADSATAAAARKLDGTNQGITSARNEAAAVMALNDPQNLIKFDKNRDVVFSYWDPDMEEWDDSAPVSIKNAARINVERSVAHNNALEPMFSRIVGLTSLEISTQSRVYISSTFGDPSDTLGVPGGHFDMETSSVNHPLLPKSCFTSECYDFNVDAHVHAYDNTYDTTTYNARSPRGGSLHAIQQDTVGKGNFKLVIVNANLSPGIDIIVNGVRQRVTNYAQIAYNDLPVFNSTSLTELRLEVSGNSFDDAELHRTIPQCARANISGMNGEWRNGALTVQAISTTTGILDSTIPAAGGQGVAQSGMLHELIMFWHAGSYCYSDPLWEAEWDVIGKKLTHFLN
jgi:Flp pilus assembly protein TadG